MTLLIHEGKKTDDLFLKDGTIPNPRLMDNVEFKIVQTIIKIQLDGGETDNWDKICQVHCARPAHSVILSVSERDSILWPTLIRHLNNADRLDNQPISIFSLLS